MADGSIVIDTKIDQSGLTTGLKATKTNLMSTFGMMRDVMQGPIGAFKLGADAVMKVADEINKLTEAYKGQIRAETQLISAAQNNPYLTAASVKALKAYASEIQSYTTYGDEELLPMMAKLAAAGRTQDEIMKIMATAVDMAASGAFSLDGAVNNLNKSYGGLSGELGESIPEIKSLTEEQLKNGAAVELLAERYKGIAKDVRDNVGGAEALANSLGDAREELGAMFTDATEPMNNLFAALIGNWAAAKKAQREYREEGAKAVEAAGLDKKTEAKIKKGLQVYSAGLSAAEAAGDQEKVKKILGEVAEAFGVTDLAVAGVAAKYHILSDEITNFQSKYDTFVATTEKKPPLKKAEESLTGFAMAIRQGFGETIGAEEIFIDLDKNLMSPLIKSFKTAGELSAKSFMTETKNGFLENLHIATAQAKKVAIQIGAAISKGISIAGTVISGAMSVISSLVALTPDDLLESMEDILDGLTTFFTETLGSLPIFIDAGLTMIESFISGILSNLPAIIETANNVISYLAEQLKTRGAKIASAAVTIIMALATAIIDNLPEIVTAAIAISLAVLTGILVGLPEIIKGIATAMPLIIKALTDAVPLVIQALADNIDEILIAYAEALPQIIVALMMYQPMLIAAIILAAPDIAAALIEGLINGLVNGIPALISGMIKAFNLFISAVKDFFGIHSPSTIFAGFGVNLIEGLIEGMLSAGALIWDAVKGIFTGLLENIKNVFAGIADVGSSIINGIVSGVTSAAESAGGIVSTVGSAIVSGVSTAASAVGSAASTAGSAVVSAGSSAVNFVKSWFANGTSSAPGGLAGINEKGAELVTLPSGSKVMTAAATAEIFGKGIASILSGIGSMGMPSMTPALAGGGSITIHNQITAPVTIDGYQTARAVYENWDKVAR